MLNQDDIKKIIPHRDPFLFLDKVDNLIPLKSATGYKFVSEDEEFFKGHFPNEPVMPGVLILEAMAQVGAVVVLVNEEYKNKIVYFTGADNVKFRKKVLPGDTLRLECEVIKLRKRFGVGEAKAYVGDELACEGLIKFAID